ncbi:unnamed protein product [Mucor hiemalis]
MAPIKVIGASLGRCGTDSMRVALDMLGYKTHHGTCFLQDPNLSIKKFYEAALDQEHADWDYVYEGFDAAVDWMGSTCYKSLLSKYLDAKVLLTVRSADSWYKSVGNTMMKANVEFATIDPENPIYYFYQLTRIVALDGYAFDPKKFADEEYVKKLFNAHIEEVKRVVPADQLLVLELGEGWDRLCHFLGKEVPDVPYPSVNSTAEFVECFIDQVKVANARREEKVSA